MNATEFRKVIINYICLKNGYKNSEIIIMNDVKIHQYLDNDNMKSLGVEYSDGEYVFRIILERHNIDILKRSYTINQIINN